MRRPEGSDHMKKVMYGIWFAAGAVLVFLAMFLVKNQAREALMWAEGPAAASSAKQEEPQLQEEAQGTEEGEAVADDGHEGEAAGIAASSAESPVEAEPEVVTITVSAAGDCTLGRDEGNDYSMSFNKRFEEHADDPGWFLREVQSAFGTDDLTIVNFEGTLTTETTREDKTFAFKGDPSYVSVLTEGSVEACNVANNHSFDYGTKSYEDTKKYLEEAGIVTFGYDRSQVIDVKGIKVGLVGTYELERGIGCKEIMLGQIDWVKENGAQLIIASFHWGDEGYYHPNDIQIELAHAAIDAGADLVIGHHPHLLQDAAVYNGVHILYSLGNFCFGGNKNPGDKDTLIFQQTFTFVDGELERDDNVEFIPCRLSSTTEYNNYQPVIVEGEDAERVLGKVLTGNY